jgi:lysyl-tRNA synthetase class 2
MNWWLPHNFNKKRPYLEKRSQVIKALRHFFEARYFSEVHTPALQICPVMDAHIQAFKTTRYSVGRISAQDMYLHTSPEFDMKKLLAAGMERIYQICPVYRNAEGSPRHSPEFMILEWYRAGDDYHALMDDCEELLCEIAKALDITRYCHKDAVCDPFQPFERISVCEAFEHFAGIDLAHHLDNLDSFANAAQAIGVRTIQSDKWDDIFHAIMADKIEPYLGQRRATILYDYPVSMAALSRRKPSDTRFAERFELYVCGMELANAFSELTDSKEQRDRFKMEMVIKQELYGEVYPADEEFFLALDYMPKSAGIALGVERLIMLAADTSDINNVLWAPLQIID